MKKTFALLMTFAAVSAMADDFDTRALFQEAPRGNEVLQPDDVVCTQEYRPVCAEDGQTYSNACVAEAAGATVAFEGVCNAEQTDCGADIDPVCGVDGNTYANECFARTAGVSIAGLGECTVSGCPATNDPVCGV
ncbi:MAG: Kazal-type serine protease inhibitor, partial [Pseudomonadota bacterium]